MGNIQSARTAVAASSALRWLLDGGYERQLQAGFKGRELARSFSSAVSGKFVARRIEPFLDRVMREPGALCDLADRELVAQSHAPDQVRHVHSDHLVL
jgi:hypothetical protein